LLEEEHPEWQLEHSPEQPAVFSLIVVLNAQINITAMITPTMTEPKFMCPSFYII
jgi:hypothetical protein